jgi:isopenicillin-N N-acyltransferase like protein
MVAALREVVVGGTPHERGLAHGRAVGEEIRRFLGDGVARINRIRSVPLSPAELRSRLDAHRGAIESEVPELARELEGLAIGAEITLDEAYTLQLRRELIGAPEGPAAGDCSTIAGSVGGRELLAQTVDQEGLIADLGMVLRVLPSSSREPEVLMFTFSGLLGYLGLNSRGVAVAINLLTSEDSAAGVPPYLLIREVLRASSASEAVAQLQRVRRASARAFTIMDSDGVVCCEFTPRQFRSWRAKALVRANHFLSEELRPLDALNIFSQNGSRRRMAILEEALQRMGDSDSEAVFRLLSDHSLYPAGICAHAEGQLRRPDTVAAVVMDPSLGKLWVRKGHPCSSQTSCFSLRGGINPDRSSH